jgi:hypothetical protein
MPRLLLDRVRHLRGRATLPGGEPGQRTALAGAPPLHQVRRAQALATQQGADLARLRARLGLGQDLALVLGGELPPARLRHARWQRGCSAATAGPRVDRWTWKPARGVTSFSRRPASSESRVTGPKGAPDRACMIFSRKIIPSGRRVSACSPALRRYDAAPPTRPGCETPLEWDTVPEVRAPGGGIHQGGHSWQPFP